MYRIFLCVECSDESMCLEAKSIKAEETSPQHPSVKKDRENVEINDYEEEGDLEEEEVCSGENGERQSGDRKKKLV